MSKLVVEGELTTSDTEMQRLNTIHWAMRELWQTSVRVPIPHPAVRILDVGCGSGIWAREVAEVLPRSRVMGVDLSPVFLFEEPNRPIPDNLSYEVLGQRWFATLLIERSTTSTSVFNILKQASILLQVVS